MTMNTMSYNWTMAYNWTMSYNWTVSNRTSVSHRSVASIDWVSSVSYRNMAQITGSCLDGSQSNEEEGTQSKELHRFKI